MRGTWFLSALLILVHGCDDQRPPARADADPSLSPAYCSYEAPRPSSTRPGAPGPVLAGAPGPVLAGVAEGPLDLPVGTPLGGYTARLGLLGGTAPDARRSPYATTFVPSAGTQTTPQARALFLQVGTEQLLLIKADLCVAYDRLVYDLERAVFDGDSGRGRVVLTTSHTHSGPATYQGVFHLSLGFDQFSERQYQRLLLSLVQAARRARQGLAPARLGLGVWDGWDGQDEIFSDRRRQDDDLPGPDGKPIGPHKDGRLMVVRVDDGRSGEPLAVLFHFPMHGTVAGDDNPLMSVEAPGHVELALEARFRRPVLAMHLQGPAGDASPRGPSGLSGCAEGVCADFARMEAVGEIAAPRIYALWQATAVTDQAELEVVTRAVADGRAVTVRGGRGYAPFDETIEVDTSPQAIYGEDGQVRWPLRQFNVRYGAGLCGDKAPPLPLQTIAGATGIPFGSCVDLEATIQFLGRARQIEPPKVPECEASRTTLSALRLSGVPVTRRTQDGAYAGRTEEVLLATLPGEPVSLLADRLRARSPFGPERTFVLGYAQGHVGYLLEVENWLKGGYEPSINIYGPLEGEHLLERSLEVLQVAATHDHEEGDEGGSGRLIFQPGPLGTPGMTGGPAAAEAGLVPADLTFPDLPPLRPRGLFRRARAGLTEAQPALAVLRVVGRATFVFYGGEPGEGTPVVTLEREQAPGVFEPVLRRSGRALSSRGPEVLLTYTPLPVDAAPGEVRHHVWVAEWQAVGWDRDDGSVGLLGARSAPLQAYRFAVAGQAGGKAYAAHSRAFTVVADGAIGVTAAATADRVSGRAVYPVGAGYRLLRLSGPSNGDVPAWGSATVRVVGSGWQIEKQVALADGRFEVAVPGGSDLRGAQVTVQDADGNRGQVRLP